MGQEGSSPTQTPTGTGTTADGTTTTTTTTTSGGMGGGGEVTTELREVAVGFAEYLGVPLGLVQLAMALAILVVAWYGAKVLTQLLGRRIARRFRRPSISRTVIRLIRVGVWIFGGLLVLNLYSVPLSNIALSVTVFSAVVGVVLAPIVGSVISGLFVLADEPYEVGDMIEIVNTGQTGFVEEITLRYTKVFTLDNTFLVLPNGLMRDRDIVNYSAEDTRTRLSLDVTVTYEGDLAEARRIMENAARSCENVIEGGPDIRIGSARYPAAPTCYIDEFADHGVRLRLRYWVSDPYKLLTMRSRVQTAVWDRLADADVQVAYPHSHVVFDDTSGALTVRSPNGGASGTDRASTPQKPGATNQPAETDTPAATDTSASADESDGTEGPNGTDGPDGTEESNGSDGPNETDGPDGTDGAGRRGIDD